MIQNKVEYEITKAEVTKFKASLQSLSADQSDVELWMVDLQRHAMESEVEILESQISEYEAHYEGYYSE